MSRHPDIIQLRLPNVIYHPLLNPSSLGDLARTSLPGSGSYWWYSRYFFALYIILIAEI